MAAMNDARVPSSSTRVAPKDPPLIETGSRMGGSCDLTLITGVPVPMLKRIVSTRGDGLPAAHPATGRLVLAAVIASRRVQTGAGGGKRGSMTTKPPSDGLFTMMVDPAACP